jgi:signal transduction histidine kinase
MWPSGGILEVALGELHIGKENSVDMCLDPGRYLRLTVRDTGKGIDNAIINRIFDPFFTTKEENKGAGLGLFVVLGVVKGYGGNISVTSALSEGTVIDVYLPGIDMEDKHWRQNESTDTADGKIAVEGFRGIRRETTTNMPV